MPPTIVSLLSERPESELRKMLESARRNFAQLQEDLLRSKLEVEQIEQALTRQARDSHPTRRGETREQVLEAVEASPGITSPAQIIETLRANGVSVSAGAIRNMIRRLVDEEMIERVGEGQYQPASRNGFESNPLLTLSENEAGEPLSTATQPHEAASES